MRRPTMRDPVKGHFSIRICSAIIILFSIIELALDVVVYVGISNIYIGAWWAAVFNIVTSVLAIFAVNRGTLIAACSIGMLSICAGFIGCVVDGLSSGIIRALEACVSGPNTWYSRGLGVYPGIGLTYTGNENYYDEAFTCYVGHYSENADCICVNGSSESCFFYDGAVPSSGCEHIGGSYLQILYAATAFDVLAFAALFALNVMLFSSLCCPASYGPVEELEAVHLGAIHDGGHKAHQDPSDESNLHKNNPISEPESL